MSLTVLRRVASRFVLALLLSLCCTVPAAADYVWIEAESLPQPPAGFKVGGWGNQHYLSGGKWLFAGIDGKEAEAIPAEGLRLSYPFENKADGTCEVWARIGYEFARSPFRWRIDDGAWGEDKPEDLTTDLMSLQEWNEVAWIKLGTARLTPGKHTLQIHFERRVLPGKKQPERILTGLDCFCISKEPFRPNGRFKPDEDYRDDTDREAAKHVFRVDAAPGQRSTLPLKGLWEIARWDEQDISDRDQPVRQLPADHGNLFWKAARVPGDRDTVRPELLYCHRFLYRTRLQVPAQQGDRTSSYVLRFPSTALLASVFVNGKLCAANATPCAAWDADITAAVVPGKVNEVVVAIKDLYYAIEKTGDGKSVRMLFNYPADWFYSGAHGGGATRNADFPVLLQVRGAGIFETPTLTVTGAAYTADAFVVPSVAKKELRLELTLFNSWNKDMPVEIENEVVPLGGGPAELTMPASRVVIAAGAAQAVTIPAKWANPKLWWPDDPKMYEVVTRLRAGGKVIDEKRTRFGFREWQWTGQTFKLNGVPWHFHADTSYHGPVAEKDRARVADYWKKTGINTVRYWGQRPWIGDSQEETLDWFDSIGMPIRRTGIFDGEGGSYNLTEQKDGKNVARKKLFDNWIRQMQAWVKAERNHPSVFVWSIENEITFINIRNFGLHDPCEPEIRRAVQAVMAADPTRPAMIDGGDALRDRSLPVYGNHYNEAHFREYPDEAYTMKLAFARHKDPWTPWPLGDDRPLFIGESFYANGYPPAAYAAVSGEPAFLGRNQSEPGVHKFARMLAEGYRWHGLAGFTFWFTCENPAAEHYKAFQPVCVFCREWNSALGGGETVTRTLKVFNDTHSGEPIEVKWSFRVAGKVEAEGTETFALEPGTAKEFTITFRAPKVDRRTAGELVLACHRGGARVFGDVKPLVVLAGMPEPPQLNPNQVIVYDPRGAVQPWLKQRGYPFREVTSLDKLPERVVVLIVGPDALTPREATDPRWVALAARGARVLVLDQAHPLHYQAVPADLTPTDHAGRIAFPENLEHPAFAGLGTPDFFCWSGDHVVYRHAYKKASRGARSLLQCDDELSCTALVECPVQQGALVLSQAAIGGKLSTDPVAQRLLDNLLRYCLSYRLVARTTLTVFPDGDLRLKLLDATGLKHTRAAGVSEAIADPKAEIVVADASPANLATLAAAKEKLEAFTARGGYLMLWSLTPEGLASYNQLVGINHVLRPFGMERVTLPALRDPILSGLTNRDVAQEGAEAIYPWAADRYPARDTFTHVVDLDDIAPFAKSAHYGHGWAQMTNGLTSADSWKFIFYHELKSDPHPKWSAELPREEEVTRFAIVLNTHYQVIRKLRLIFDDNQADALTLDLKGIAELKEEFALDRPRRCKKITLEPVEIDTRGKQPTTGVDNIWITVARGADYRARVVPLLNMGALVKYRLGKGGIVLNQLRVQASEPNPVNGPKKLNIVATLLRNLGATFAAERLVAAGGNVQYTPVPLNDRCTAFLTADRGWIPGQPDLAQLPIGEQRLVGVDYLIRDFKTSPLPACIMLDGPGVKTGMPRAVDDIPVGRKADVLFFLHTFHHTKDWRPANDQEKQTPPMLFRYVVRYQDGQTVEVPVRYGRGAGPFVAEEPQGLADAAVAWAAPVPKDGKRQVVVYQMAWTNPRPGVAIRSIDVHAGDGYGVPVVLAITAGTVRE
jgi:beta-galactosidase